MRKLVLAALLGVLLPFSSADAQQSFGAGIVLGAPTGLTIKQELTGDSALDAALSIGRDRFYVHGSWLTTRPTSTRLDGYPLSWYLGIGPRALRRRIHRSPEAGEKKSEMHLGARAPAGLRMNFTAPKIELFAELALILDVVPETEADLDLGIGARYYF